jgi:hypothetical protein
MEICNVPMWPYWVALGTKRRMFCLSNTADRQPQWVVHILQPLTVELHQQQAN